ncbi:MAG: TetR/AcrR family transcriptional regulator [Dehalococcoidia bacterium]
MAKRDPEGTRARLLEAAFHEFSQFGPAGARVQRIVERAQVNPRMLYHYFGSKEGLFRELLRTKTEEMAARRDRPAESFPAAIGDVALRMFEDRAWIRMLMWEALSYGDGNIVLEAERSAAWAPAISRLQEMITSGALPEGLDAAQFQLSLIALATYPVAFPNTSKMVTGMDPESNEFAEARGEAVGGLVEALLRR